MATKNKDIVQNGKIIPHRIIKLLGALTEWLMDESPPAMEQKQQMFQRSWLDIIDQSDAVHEGDMERALKAVALAAVEAVADLTDADDDLTFEDATKSQAEVLKKLDECRAISTTLLFHMWAEERGEDIPSDLRLDADMTVYSESFEDAD